MGMHQLAIVPDRLPQIEHALRERVKELECVYRISALREAHFSSADAFLQGVVDCLPASWQWPEHCSARLTYRDALFITRPFRAGPWRMSAEVAIGGAAVGEVEVFYTSDVPVPPDADAFLKEEHALLHVVAERVSSALAHMQTNADLRDAHEVLQRQNQALIETNIALKTVLSRLEDEKREIRSAIADNIEKIILPIVLELELSVTGRPRAYVTLLRQSLQEIASPLLSTLTRRHVELSPVEVAISTMIRNGLSTKEIAQLRLISPGTVRRHRENIRKKLGLQNRQANLVTYLQNASDLPVGRGQPQQS